MSIKDDLVSDEIEQLEKELTASGHKKSAIVTGLINTGCIIAGAGALGYFGCTTGVEMTTALLGQVADIPTTFQTSCAQIGTAFSSTYLGAKLGQFIGAPLARIGGKACAVTSDIINGMRHN